MKWCAVDVADQIGEDSSHSFNYFWSLVMHRTAKSSCRSFVRQRVFDEIFWPIWRMVWDGWRVGGEVTKLGRIPATPSTAAVETPSCAKSSCRNTVMTIFVRHTGWLIKFSDQFDEGCEVDGGGGGGGLTKLGRIQATPSTAAAASAFQHSSVCWWVRTSAQPILSLLKTIRRLLIFYNLDKYTLQFGKVNFPI